MSVDKVLTIGQRFKQIRKDKGISQKDLCEGICSDSVVSHIETDRQYPSAHIWGKLAERLGVQMYEIIGEEEKEMDVSFQLDMIRIYIETGNCVHALDLLSVLETREELLEHQRVDLIICRGDGLVKNGQYRQAIDHLMSFVQKQEVVQTVSDELLCHAYDKLGEAYYKLRKFEKAYSAFAQGHRISLKLPAFGLVSARVTKNLGLTCNQLLLVEDAAEYLQQAQVFFDSISDLKGLADTLFALAISTNDASSMQKAHSLYENLNLVKEAIGVKEVYAILIESQTNYLKAVQTLSFASNSFEQAGESTRPVYTLSMAAIICIENDDLEKANLLLRQAEEYKANTQQENMYHFADYHRARALLHFKMGNYDQCIIDSKISSDMCAKMGLYAESATSLQLTAKAYHQLGRDGEAYRVSEEVIQLLQRTTPRRYEK